MGWAPTLHLLFLYIYSVAACCRKLKVSGLSSHQVKRNGIYEQMPGLKWFWMPVWTYEDNYLSLWGHSSNWKIGADYEKEWAGVSTAEGAGYNSTCPQEVDVSFWREFNGNGTWQVTPGISISCVDDYEAFSGWNVPDDNFPVVSTLDGCKKICNSIVDCTAFSRSSSVHPDTEDDCYLLTVRGLELCNNGVCDDQRSEDSTMTVFVQEGVAHSCALPCDNYHGTSAAKTCSNQEVSCSPGFDVKYPFNTCTDCLDDGEECCQAICYREEEGACSGSVTQMWGYGSAEYDYVNVTIFEVNSVEECRELCDVGYGCHGFSVDDPNTRSNCSLHLHPAKSIKVKDREEYPNSVCWIKRQSACKCDGLKAPANGRMLMNARSHLSVASFHCDPGYGLRGPINVTCNAPALDSNWPTVDVSCQLLPCPAGYVGTPPDCQCDRDTKNCYWDAIRGEWSEGDRNHTSSLLYILIVIGIGVLLLMILAYFNFSNGVINTYGYERRKELNGMDNTKL